LTIGEQGGNVTEPCCESGATMISIAVGLLLIFQSRRIGLRYANSTKPFLRSRSPWIPGAVAVVVGAGFVVAGTFDLLAAKK
jgi:hypothetical protein